MQAKMKKVMVYNVSGQTYNGMARGTNYKILPQEPLMMDFRAAEELVKNAPANTLEMKDPANCASVELALVNELKATIAEKDKAITALTAEVMAQKNRMQAILKENVDMKVALATQPASRSPGRPRTVKEA